MLIEHSLNKQKDLRTDVRTNGSNCYNRNARKEWNLLVLLQTSDVHLQNLSFGGKGEGGEIKMSDRIALR